MSDCIFCRIISKEIPASFFYKDDKIVAFKDINPKAPVHILIVPVKHIVSLRGTNEEDKVLLGEIMYRASKIAVELGISEGFKIVINNGKEAGQLVFHLHVHLLGGWKRPEVWKV